MDVNVKTLDRRDLYPASSDFVGQYCHKQPKLRPIQMKNVTVTGYN